MNLGKRMLVTTTVLAAGGLGSGLTSDGAGAEIAAGGSAPALTVRPSTVVLNAETVVTGHHFKAHAKVALLECSHTMWIAPRQPCDSGNGVIARTDAAGAFRVRIKVRLCPNIGVPAGGSEKCDIGVVSPSGVDVIELQPNAKIVVTLP